MPTTGTDGGNLLKKNIYVPNELMKKFNSETGVTLVEILKCDFYDYDGSYVYIL